MNKTIRGEIMSIIGRNGNADTRNIIDAMAVRFNTSKQRISGNISYMVTSGMVDIERNKPTSIIY